MGTPPSPLNYNSRRIKPILKPGQIREPHRIITRPAISPLAVAALQVKNKTCNIAASSCGTAGQK